MLGRRLLVKRGSTHMGIREADGSIWRLPNFGSPTDILTFDRDQAFGLIADPERPQPLTGHRVPPDKEWLQEPEDVRKTRKIRVDGPMQPGDVHSLLATLLWAYKENKARISRAYTAENLKHAERLLNRARTLQLALLDPRTSQVYPPAARAQSIAEIERDIARYRFTVEMLEKGIAELRNKGEGNLEEFIRGPLAACYERLFGRRPGRKWKLDGPFMRFAQRFFTLVEHPVQPATIASALKGRSRKKPTSPDTPESRRTG